jgi:N-acetylneuraminic acid mutarotase
VCDDGSIFVDRDGEHFGHVLEYMRDGHVSVAEPGARPSVSLLRALKREFGFYCIELCAEVLVKSVQAEVAFVMGRHGHYDMLSGMERYDASSDTWSTVADLGIARTFFGACACVGELYVTGGFDSNNLLPSVEKYSPASDTWSNVAPLPEGRQCPSAVAVGSAVYVLGGRIDEDDYDYIPTASVLKFDGVNDAWSQITPMPETRYDVAACALGSNVFVFGGQDAQRAQASVFKYDTEADVWSTLAFMPRPAYGHSASVLNGMVYITGAGNDHSEVLRFDPVSEVWGMLALMLANHLTSVTFVLCGCLYVVGGIGLSAAVQRYNAATDAWTAVANMLQARRSYGAVTIGSAGPAEDQDLFDSLIAKAAHRDP